MLADISKAERKGKNGKFYFYPLFLRNLFRKVLLKYSKKYEKLTHSYHHVCVLFFNSLEHIALYIGEAPQKERGRTTPGLGIGLGIGTTGVGVKISSEKLSFS